jgi:hypothetical protein
MNRSDNNGVSEAIGFIIILGIVVTGIGLVTLSGYPMLLEHQQNANVRNMEKNMLVLQSEENLLTYKGVPYRETSMQISGGNLRVVNPNPSGSGPGDSNFVINVYESDIAGNSASQVISKRVYPGLLEYSSDSANEIIALQNGAVVTNGFSETGGSTMLSEPRWFLDNNDGNNTLILSLINIKSEGYLSATGIGTVQMSVIQENTTDISNSSVPYNVDLMYNYGADGYLDAWRNYFNNKQVFGTTSSVPPSTPLTVSIKNVDRVVIKNFTITVHNV